MDSLVHVKSIEAGPSNPRLLVCNMSGSMSDYSEYLFSTETLPMLRTHAYM